MSHATLAATPKEDKGWMIQSAADTLLDAKRIKKDKPLHKAALVELRKRRTAISEALKK